MYYGELNEHSEDYKNGHATGSMRAYSDAIHRFENMAKDDAKSKYTADEVAKMLAKMKANWLYYCDTFGCGKDGKSNHRKEFYNG